MCLRKTAKALTILMVMVSSFLAAPAVRADGSMCMGRTCAICLASGIDSARYTCPAIAGSGSDSSVMTDCDWSNHGAAGGPNSRTVVESTRVQSVAAAMHEV